MARVVVGLRGIPRRGSRYSMVENYSCESSVGGEAVLRGVSAQWALYEATPDYGTDVGMCCHDRCLSDPSIRSTWTRSSEWRQGSALYVSLTLSCSYRLTSNSRAFFRRMLYRNKTSRRHGGRRATTGRWILNVECPRSSLHRKTVPLAHPVFLHGTYKRHGYLS